MANPVKSDAWDPAFWAGKRVLITGHTGFKGAWLFFWLSRLGARVSGFSLPSPSRESLAFEAVKARAEALGAIDLRGDLTRPSDIAEAVERSRPEVVFHLAAQAIVLDSYTDPVGSWEVNVMGALSLLQELGSAQRECVFIGVTSDKCYENQEWAWGYRESDPLGGSDPYSASKAACEIMLASWRRSFSEKTGVRVASARAGNVIGGGDNAPSRIMPDLLAAFSEGRPATLRNPDSTRPYQHVLEPLSGYMGLARAMVERPGAFERSYNFGPDSDGERKTLWLAETAAELWGQGAQTRVEPRPNAPREANVLMLDSSLARRELGWSPQWRAKDAVLASIAWHQSWRVSPELAAEQTEAQIKAYEDGLAPTPLVRA